MKERTTPNPSSKGWRGVPRASRHPSAPSRRGWGWLFFLPRQRGQDFLGEQIHLRREGEQVHGEVAADVREMLIRHRNAIMVKRGSGHGGYNYIDEALESFYKHD